MQIKVLKTIVSSILVLTVCTNIYAAEAQSATASQQSGCKKNIYLHIFKNYGFGDYIEQLDSSASILKTNAPDAVFSSYFAHNPEVFSFFREGAIFLHLPESSGHDVMALYNPFFDLAMLIRIDPSSYSCTDSDFSNLRFETFDIVAGETVRREKLPVFDFPYPKWYVKHGSEGLCDNKMLNIQQLNWGFLNKLSTYHYKYSNKLYVKSERTYVERIRLMLAFQKHKPLMDKVRPNLDQSITEEIASLNDSELTEFWQELPFSEVFSVCDNSDCSSGLRYYRSADLTHFACTAFNENATKSMIGAHNISPTLEGLAKQKTTTSNYSDIPDDQSKDTFSSLLHPLESKKLSPYQGIEGTCSVSLTVDPSYGRVLKNTLERCITKAPGNAHEYLEVATDQHSRAIKFQPIDGASEPIQIKRIFNYIWQDDSDKLELISDNLYKLKDSVEYHGELGKYGSTAYSREAIAEKKEGACTAVFTVSRGGQPLDIKLENCIDLSGEPTNIFDKATVQASAHLRFKPMTVKGQQVDVTNVKHTFFFRLP